MDWTLIIMAILIFSAIIVVSVANAFYLGQVLSDINDGNSTLNRTSAAVFLAFNIILAVFGFLGLLYTIYRIFFPVDTLTKVLKKYKLPADDKAKVADILQSAGVDIKPSEL